MARKPTLSPSKITTFLACPVKYRWSYVDSRGKWYLRAHSYYSFGSTLHRVLERFHDASDAGVTTTDEAMAAYEESWIEAGFTSAEEMAEAFGEGKAIIERHVEESNRRPVTSKTLYVERQMRLDMDDFVLIGRLDRVDEHDDGSLEIVDYKSGRSEVSIEDVQTDIAMACYQLLLAERHPDRRVRASIVALKSGNSASYSMSRGELVEFREDIHKLGVTIIHSDFPDLVPVFKSICPRCDFIPLCRRHEDFGECPDHFELS